MASKRFVVVSGATGTLGTALYERLIEQGYHPILLSRDAQALQKIKSSRPDVLDIFSCDVGNTGRVAELFEQSFMKEGVVAGVVACAGVLRMGASSAFSEQDWDATIRTNLSGTFILFQKAIPHMLQGGTLIAIGSRWANGAKTASAYAASKSALRGMISSMQKEYAGTAIRPVLLSPGSIASPMAGSVNDSANEAGILMPDDVVDTILHILLSPQRVIFNEITMLAYNYDLTDEYRA
ncbi:MAG TPA: SDR family oxidoreductase [Candidatus Saccharimonadales bacterium]|nr:SDR family oxidoreductase [Candidatus Saccharimonadales bacterium]